MEYLITADKHGSFAYLLDNLQSNYGDRDPKDLGIIILGDAGLNFYLNKTDEKKKAFLNARGYTFYLVRGNHELRPSMLENSKMIYDVEIHGKIYFEEKYPNIRYLIDGEYYFFNGFNCLCLGGAYSVDKEYRLLNHYPWFLDEQLSEKEMEDISSRLEGDHFDFILSHTCPYSWMPKDLFLSFIDQSKVDNSMEIWMDNFKDKIDWDIWLFGHYHSDRLVRPGVEMFYHRIDSLESIWTRWIDYNAAGKLPDGYECDPKFFDKV